MLAAVGSPLQIFCDARATVSIKARVPEAGAASCIANVAKAFTCVTTVAHIATWEDAHAEVHSSVACEVDLRKAPVDAVEGSIMGCVHALIGDLKIKAESETGLRSAANVNIADALRLVLIGTVSSKVGICKVAFEEVEIQ